MADSKTMTYKINQNAAKFALFLSLFSAPALASDFGTARIVGLAGAGHAGPLLTDALYLNPSFISFLPSFAASGTGAFAPQPQNGNTMFGLAIQDGHQEFWFQAGMAYVFRSDTHLFTVGLAKALHKRLSIGIGAKLGIPTDPSIAQFGDVSASATYIPLEWLQLSLTAQNLIELNVARQLGFLREITLGTKFNVMSIFLVYADPHWTPSIPSLDSLGIEGGLEFPFLKDFFLRMGYFHNSSQPLVGGVRANGYGFGAGWLAPRLSIDYAFQRVFIPNGNAHYVSLTVFF